MKLRHSQWYWNQKAQFGEDGPVKAVILYCAIAYFFYAMVTA